MNNDEARFALLLREMEAIQGGIQSMDSVSFRIKGWSITVAAAAVGLAVNVERPSLVLIAVAITLAFWLIDAYFKAIQRVYIRRDLEIGKALAGNDPVQVLNLRLDQGGLYVPDLARRFQTPANSAGKVYKIESKGTFKEATKPVIYLLYLPVMLVLTATYLVLRFV